MVQLIDDLVAVAVAVSLSLRREEGAGMVQLIHLDSDITIYHYMVQY
jgi:hypothetical protein